MIELTNTMTKQELIAIQNVNNMENGSLVSRVEQNEQDISQISDYVIERGTTNGWEWEKWASGKILANKQGAMPSGTFASITGVVYLTTSFSIPASFITLNFGKLYVVDSFCTATFSTEHSNNTTAAFNVFSSYPYSNTNSMSYRCEISGTWK